MTELGPGSSENFPGLEVFATELAAIESAVNEFVEMPADPMGITEGFLALFKAEGFGMEQWADFIAGCQSLTTASGIGEDFGEDTLSVWLADALDPEEEFHEQGPISWNDLKALAERKFAYAE